MADEYNSDSGIVNGALEAYVIRFELSRMTATP